MIQNVDYRETTPTHPHNIARLTARCKGLVPKTQNMLQIPIVFPGPCAFRRRHARFSARAVLDTVSTVDAHHALYAMQLVDRHAFHFRQIFPLEI